MASRLSGQCDRRGSRPVCASVAPRTPRPFTNVRTPLRRRLPYAPPGSPHAGLSPAPSATADVIDPLGRRAHSGGGGPGAVLRALMDAVTPPAGAVTAGCAARSPARPWSCIRYRTFMVIDIFITIYRAFLQRDINCVYQYITNVHSIKITIR